MNWIYHSKKPYLRWRGGYDFENSPCTRHRSFRSDVPFRLYLGKIGGDKPWIVLAAVYLVATILSVVFGFLAGDGLSFSRAEIKTALPFLLLLAIGCVGIEGGYLWAYRSGWKVTEFMPLTSLTSGVLVLGVGCLAFQEGLSLWSGAGLALVVSGTAVMHWR